MILEFTCMGCGKHHESFDNGWAQFLCGCGHFTRRSELEAKATKLADPQTAEPRPSFFGQAAQQQDVSSLQGINAQEQYRLAMQQMYSNQAAAQANQGAGLHGDVAHRLAERDELKADNARLRKELEAARASKEITDDQRRALYLIGGCRREGESLLHAVDRLRGDNFGDHEATISKLKLNLEAKEQFNRGLETQLRNTENRVKAFWEAEHTWYKRELYRRDPKLVERHEAALAAERERGRGR